MVQEMIRTISGKEINPHEVNPDEVVALGAAIQGTLRQITDDTVETPEMPEAVIQRFIGPDGVPKVTVTDGATHNLGLVVLNSQRDYIIHVMIPKMTAVPCEIVDQFLTVDENQPTVLIEVVQGLEQDQLKDQIPFFDEYKLGECTLELPIGLPQGSPIEVNYKYNLDQNLEVTAKSLTDDGPTAVFDIFSIIERPTLNEEEVSQAQTDLQELTVE